MNIFVANINFRMEDGELQQLFEQYGAVDSCRVIKDRDTQRSRGFAFVEMTDEAEAQEAINSLDGYEVLGRPLKVSKAQPRR